LRLCLYQPEIPQNAGTLLRLGACLNVAIDIIRPCGFAMSDRQLKRAGMDYMEQAEKTFYDLFEDYKNADTGRLILLDTKATIAYTDFAFLPTDRLVVGRESNGVPASVFDMMDHQVFIPMFPPMRSLNVAVAASMVLGEALRQTGLFWS
jgi:tRNA (cytidine/uridine-2'-O-)-methyltransferase